MPSGPDASSCGRFSGNLPRRLGPIGHGPAASLGLRRGREAKGGCDLGVMTYSGRCDADGTAVAANL